MIIVPFFLISSLPELRPRHNLFLSSFFISNYVFLTVPRLMYTSTRVLLHTQFRSAFQPVSPALSRSPPSTHLRVDTILAASTWTHNEETAANCLTCRISAIIITNLIMDQWSRNNACHDIDNYFQIISLVSEQSGSPVYSNIAVRLSAITVRTDSN